MADETTDRPPQAERPPLKVDPTKLTIDDLVWLEDIGAGVKEGFSVRRLRDMLNRCVEGGIGHLPITDLRDVTAEIVRAVVAGGNPKSAASG